MNKISTILSLSLVLVAGTAFAADPAKPTTKPAPMQSMDHGKMDMPGKEPASHRKMADDMFVKLDTNKDGNLSKDEFAKHHQMMGKMHGDMSKHHDEMSADHHEMAVDEFASLDKNHDGSLGKSEIPEKHPLAMHFDMLDTNKDGSVSKTEFAKHHGM